MVSWQGVLITVVIVLAVLFVILLLMGRINL